MRTWLSRFSFSFLIIGGYLAYRALQATRGELGPIPQWQIVLYMVAAAMSFVLAVTGFRERHRPQPPGQRDQDKPPHP